MEREGRLELRSRLLAAEPSCIKADPRVRWPSSLPDGIAPAFRRGTQALGEVQRGPALATPHVIREQTLQHRDQPAGVLQALAKRRSPARRRPRRPGSCSSRWRPAAGRGRAGSRARPGHARRMAARSRARQGRARLMDRLPVGLNARPSGGRPRASSRLPVSASPASARCSATSSGVASASSGHRSSSARATAAWSRRCCSRSSVP